MPNPYPQTHIMLQSFLGLASYYHRFMSQFATLASPLTDMLGGGGKGSKPITLTPGTLGSL